MVVQWAVGFVRAMVKGSKSKSKGSYQPPVEDQPFFEYIWVSNDKDGCDEAFPELKYRHGSKGPHSADWCLLDMSDVCIYHFLFANLQSTRRGSSGFDSAYFINKFLASMLCS